MNNPKDMLVSDKEIKERSVKLHPFTQVSNGEGYARRCYVSGCEHTRAIYEAELTKLRSERDELVGFTARLLEYWDAGNFSRHVFHDELRELVAKHKPE